MHHQENEKRVLDFVLDLSDVAAEKSRIYPVDRAFLEAHLKDILLIDPKIFLLHNLNLLPELYVSRLFVCLPEIWENVSLNDLLDISEKFSNPQAYFTLIKFTYKYLEIDIINLILQTRNVQTSTHYCEQIRSYLKLQWNVLVKTDSDYEDFEDGFIEVDYNNWMYLKQKFLVDKRIRPALSAYNELKNYIMELIDDNMLCGGNNALN